MKLSTPTSQYLFQLDKRDHITVVFIIQITCSFLFDHSVHHSHPLALFFPTWVCHVLCFTFFSRSDSDRKMCYAQVSNDASVFSSNQLKEREKKERRVSWKRVHPSSICLHPFERIFFYLSKASIYLHSLY